MLCSEVEAGCVVLGDADQAGGVVQEEFELQRVCLGDSETWSGGGPKLGLVGVWSVGAGKVKERERETGEK